MILGFINQYFGTVERFLLWVAQLALGYRPPFPTAIQPQAPLDERLAKIEAARKNLEEGLEALAELKTETENAKKEHADSTQAMIDLASEKGSAEKQLEELKRLLAVDRGVMSDVLAQANSQRIWLERGIAFGTGIVASIVAATIWHFVGLV